MYSNTTSRYTKRSLNTNLSKYRSFVANVERILADSDSVETLRDCREQLERSIDEVQHTYTKLGELLDEEAYDSFTNRVEQLDAVHLSCLRRISEKIHDLEIEEGRSRSNKTCLSRARSKTFTQSSKSSSHRTVKAVAELAALETEMKFVEIEANQRAELDRVKIKKKIEIANARLAVYAQSETSVEAVNIAAAKVILPLNAGAAPFIQTQASGYMASDKPKVASKCGKGPDIAVSATVAPGAAAPTIVNKSTKPRHAAAVDKKPDAGQTAAADPAGRTNPTPLSVNDLAQRLTDQVQLTRLPAPEPGVFTGEALQYPSWKCAFEILVDRKGISEAERLYYLKRYLGGVAREAVEGYLLMPTAESYRAARQLLEERYGNPCIVANAFRDKLDGWPAVPPRDGLALRKLSDFLQQCLLAMSTNPGLHILNDERENKKILAKLPDWFLSRWVRVVTTSRENVGQFPPFREFCDMVAKEARIACDPTVSLQAMTKVPKPGIQFNKGDKTSKQSRTLATGSAESKPREQYPKAPWCALCCKNVHRLEDCKDYLEKDYDERRQLVIQKGLCFGCLRRGHLTKDCRSKLTCKECSKKHPSSLHRTFPEGREVRAVTAQGSAYDCDATLNSKTTSIVPVLLSHSQNPNKEKLVYAMLDSQSDTSFILDSTRTFLDVTGVTTTLILSTMSRCEEAQPSERITGLRVRGLNNETIISLPPTYTRGIMPVNRAHIPTSATARQWPHLEGIASQLMPECDCEVGLLIGYNCTQALTPREIVTHPENKGPYGQRTDLGWSIVGVTSPSEIEGDVYGVSHRILAKEQTAIGKEYQGSSLIVARSAIKEAIATKVKPGPSYFLQVLEQDFTEIPGPFGHEAYSQEDVRFINIMNEGITTQSDGHYELPLPLRSASLPLPPNRNMAQTRLKSLKRRFERDPAYHQAYTSVVEDLLNKGYAEKATPNQLAWYLPHHGVKHPRKPDKVRVVFDASARYEGKALNDVLMQGPDLTNKLAGVLCRFRRENVAITCDVEAMFHQFKVPLNHRDYLRFLWWQNGDLSCEPVEYRMSVHLFGATSSPSCANFGLKQIAKDHGGSFSRAASDFLIRDFYVDDGLSSQPTEAEALTLINDTKEMCSLAGLRLHKFLSNSEVVMSSVPVANRAIQQNTQGVDLALDPTSVERVLGVCWFIKNDALGFHIEIQDQPLTRRGILSTVASVYDPLGLAAPVLLPGKQILQETCRENLDWDDPLPDKLRLRWERWREDLFLLNELKVPRCYKPKDFGQVVQSELHHFADASLHGYGTCSFLRQVSSLGQIHCALVMAKARVTPLKPVTIPRLELTAATIAVQMSRFLERELGIKALHKFWTDSKAVLGYLSNETRRYQIFVANRVQEIRNSSDPDQWQHVGTKENPADLASRGCSAQELINSKCWFSGPDFLWQEILPEAESIQFEPPQSDCIKGYTLATTTSIENVLTPLFHLPWQRMKRTAALCLHMKTIMTGSLKPHQLSPVQIQAAEDFLIRSVQQEHYPDEVKNLSLGQRVVKTTSVISRLDPFVDEEGILRVGGRIKNSDLPYRAKHPALLPKDHSITRAILKHFHEATAHQGRNRTVCEARNHGFWIVGASRGAGKIISQCVTCRKIKGVTAGQKMADLPEDRLEPAPPFTHCGVDYFGPFIIKEGRKELKRWGCIFTCLSSRAIHLEVAVSLSTDDYINALRRFLSLRGHVNRIRCDCRTNFVGADNEIKAALREMNNETIQRYLADQGCQYVFNAPHSSHMGGVWERCIRTVRNILSSLLRNHGPQLNDDSLRTLLAEASAIVNSRPLSVDNPNDATAPVPITPNHLLTMKSSVVVPPPGEFQQADLYSRKRWRRVQHLANVFWTRWRTEYVHQLQVRQKWLRPQRNLITGDIVLLIDNDLPRSHWRLGRIVEATAADDGLVRKAKILVGDPLLDSKGCRVRPASELERPVHKLVLILESSDT